MNELLLQRCVDGEMTSTERGDFLTGLGEDVVQWKQLACRLLDERELEAGCRDWMTEFAPPDLLANRVARISSAGTGAHELNGHASSNGKASSVAHLARRADEVASTGQSLTTTSQIKSKLALVVAGILGVAIGLGLNGGGNDDVTTNLADGVTRDQTDDDSHADVSVTDAPEALAFSTILLTLETPDGPRQYEVPVIGSDELTTLASMGSSISPDLREQLSRRGFRLDEVPGVIKLPVDDATSVAVPVHAVQMRNVGL